MQVGQKTNERVIKLSRPQMAVMRSRTPITAQIAGQGSGKTMVIGLLGGYFITHFPKVIGFIAANTYEQLSSSTLSRVFEELEKVYGLIQYDAKEAPWGHYVVGRKPPKKAGWEKPVKTFKTYNNIITFWNGCTVFTGSLDNYGSHDGKEFGWAQLDETKDTKKEAITTVILGRLRQIGLWTDGKDVFYYSKDDMAKALAKGLRSWTPLFIHTSPGENNVQWLVELLKLEPYAKEIKAAIIKKDSFFNKVVNENRIVNYSSYWNAANLAPNFLSDMERTKSAAEILKYIYGYIFSKSGGEFFPNFDRLKHVRPVAYVKGLPIHTAWDFNSMPYITLEIAQVQYVIRYWDDVAKHRFEEPGPGRTKIEVLQIRFFMEKCMRPPVNTTEQAAAEIIKDFTEDNPDIFVYGDASGRNRIVGLGALTQYKIISGTLEQQFYLQNGYLRVPAANMNTGKRRDLMNRIWEDKIPEVEVVIDPSCTELIRDCDYLLQNAEGGKHIEKEKDSNGVSFEKLGHTSDAMEYMVCELCKAYLKDF